MSSIAPAATHDTVMVHLRVAVDVAHEWAGHRTSIPARHRLREDRLRATWPTLAGLLDSLIESLPSDEDETALARAIAGSVVACPACGQPATMVKSAPDPHTAVQTHRVQPCGHTVTREDAVDLWERGLTVDVTPLDGAALIRAEVRRNRDEKGRTVEGDIEHDAGELAWGAWCLLDRMNSDDETEPMMWPEALGEWKPERTRMRSLIVAGALIASEIDRLLWQGAQGRTVQSATQGGEMVDDAAHD